MEKNATVQRGSLLVCNRPISSNETTERARQREMSRDQPQTGTPYQSGAERAAQTSEGLPLGGLIKPIVAFGGCP